MLISRTRGFTTRLIFIFSLLALVSGTVCAQALLPSTFKRVNGLSERSPTIKHIAEDKYGFIWVNSTNGLMRFDGYESRNLANDNFVDTPILNSELKGLISDQLGRIWIATSDGMARYDAETEKFIIFNKNNSALIDSNITALATSQSGTLLFTDSYGLYQYSVVTDSIQRIDTTSFPDTEVTLIYDDGQKIWLGTTENGVYALEPKTGKIYSLSSPNPWNLRLPFQSLFSIEQFLGSYWLGTNQGLFEISNDNLVIDVFKLNDRIDLKQSEIRDLALHENKLWMASNNGLLSINANKVIQQTLINEETDSDDSLGNIIYSLYSDRKNVLWLGTYGGTYRKLPFDGRAPALIHEFMLNKKPQKMSEIWAVKPQTDGGVWSVGVNDSIYYLWPGDDNIAVFSGMTNSDIWDLSVDKQQNLWIATSDGVKHFTTSKSSDDMSLNYEKTIFPNSLIDSLFQDGEFIWFWHNSFEVIQLEISSGDTIVHDAPNAIRVAQPIARDDLGRVWFNTNMGVMLLDKQTKQFELPFDRDQYHPLDEAKITAFHSFAGFYYVVTDVQGIYKLDKKNLSVVDSLEKNVPEIMSAIGVGNTLWYAGPNNIHEVQLPRLIYGENLGGKQLEGNELWEWAVGVSENGMLYFGGANGITRFHPSYLYEQTPSKLAPPAPLLTNFSVFALKVEHEKSGRESILTKPLFLTDSIELDNTEDTFTLEFAVINPLQADLLQYRYKLIGFDEDWNTQTKGSSATYRRLDFGDYEFEVQARTIESGWSPSTRLKINIAAPIWLHKHALIFYGFFISLVAIYVIRQYQSRKASQLAIQESEERLKLTLWSSGDELWDWDIYGGQVHRSNTWGTLDFPQDDIRTNSAYEPNIHPNDIERVKAAINEHLAGNSEFYEITFRAKTYKGEWVWLLDRGKVVKRDQNDNPLRMTGTLKNIQHLKQAEEQLYLFKRSIENISEGVFITNTDFRFVSVNNAYCNYTGETREKALASYLFFHQYPDAFTQEIKKTLQQKGNWSGEVESIKNNGERFEIELNIDAVYGDDSKISHYVGVFSDITSRKNTEQELLKLANVDSLTDLPNRSFFQASHQNLVRKDVPHTLMCLDMDNFKKINDSLGHQTGDILIKQIARRVQRITGSVATCYRLGGDEFSLLIENKADVHTVTHFAQSVLDTLARPFVINKQEFVLSASLGIAFYPDDGNSPQELLKNADTAMYFAKNSGGNCYQFFSGEMNQNAVRQLQIENLIRQGLRDNLFTVFYQPKVDITSGKLVSMEALVRFEHPQKGIVSPSQFIPLAEQTGQIIDIGEQVLRQACEDTKRWVNSGLFTGRVAVNISAKQFELPDLDDRIDRILRQVGLSPLHLECEITEGTLMENPEQGLKLMQRLRERGIHLALDDFGTGYSSLAYLKRFPLNTLKIDKAFIDDIAVSSVDRHMAAAIINIAHNLGLKVVAEGVENESQLSILRRYDCEMLQGFLYSKALTAEKFEKLLSENHKLHQLIGEPNNL